MTVAKNLLQMNAGHKAYGQQVLFGEATFSLNEGEHVGVIGPNGAGKSTLFKILTGEEDIDAGQVIRSQSLRLGYLSQHDQWLPEDTGNTYLRRVCKIPDWQAKAAGRDLQMSEEILSRPILSLSGGYRMRIKLLGLLGMDPNLMLLDEPTNYLDLETTLLLERFLQNYQGAFLLISHDREVLRRTTDHILEVEGGEIVKYNGNIDDYFEQKELLRSQLQAQAQNQSLKRKAILDFVNRFGAKAAKARQAQSRLKTLEKMEVIEFKPAPVTATIRIPQPAHVGKSIVKLDQADFGYQDRTILSQVNLEIKRGDHVAVVGLNGAGKSTLLKGLAGTLKPLVGQYQLGFQVELAIFNQHVVEFLDSEDTVYASLQHAAASDVTGQDIRDMAGSLLFSSDSIQKKIKVLSGGEKSRVALGRILLQKVPFLLLDEPTNHLDFQTVEALTQALNKYTGTLVVVSHDRSFIRRVGSKILEVSKGDVFLYPGTYDEYVWSLQQRLSQAQLEESESKPKIKSSNLVQKPVKENSSKKLRQLDSQIERCQKQMEELEKSTEQLNLQIASGQGTLQMTQDMAENFTRIQALEAQWLELMSQREQLI